MIPAFLLAARAFLARLPAWVWYVAGILALAGIVLSLAECSARRRAADAVKLDRAAASTEAATRALNADRSATANQMARDAITANQTQELHDEARKGDDRPVGPGTRAVLDRMRQQQSTVGR